jgi:hypothetical protein
MPRIWVGFCFAGLTLLVAVFADPHSVNFALLPPLITLAGWFYWLYCVFKYHILFSSGIYLSHRIKAACLAPPVPRAMHASASAGPLGIG